MRAITLLSQREHSTMELRRKLLRISLDMKREAARGLAQPGGAAGEGMPDDDAGDAGDADESLTASAHAEVDALLTWLQAQGYHSESRFVDSRIHARASRYGSLRIRQELAQHGLALSAEHQAELKATEAERAKVVWQRKFGGGLNEAAAAVSPADPAQRARQMRFLSARGFAPDVVRRTLRSTGED